MLRNTRIALVAVWLGSSLSMCGRIILQEAFDYPEGVLTEVSNGIWRHHGGQLGEVDVAGGAVCLNQTETEDVHTLLESGPYPPASPEAFLFVSLTVRFASLPAGATGGYFAHFKDASTGYRCRLFATTNDVATGKFRLGLSSAANAASVLFPKDLDLTQDCRVVLQYCLSNATCNLWIDPESEAALNVSAADVGSAIGIAGFALRQNQGIGMLTADDLLIGTAFADVCPGSTNNWEKPRIILPPQNLTVRAGETACFSVTVDGAAPFWFQWQFNRADLATETNAMLTLTNLNLSQAGYYRVVISNILGTEYSPEAVLNVEMASASGFSLGFTNHLTHLIRAGDLLTNSFVESVLNPDEELVLYVAVTHQSGLPFELRVPSDTLPGTAFWELPAAPGNPGLAIFRFQPTLNQAGSNYSITLEARENQAATNWTWQIYVPTQEEQAIVINEFLANPTTDTASSHFNPLGRNPPPSNPAVADEYVEIINVGSQATSMGGWSLSDSTKIRHRFPDGCNLAAAESIVVYGGPQDGFPPAIDTASMPASEGASGLGLNNTGIDMLVLRNANGHLVARVVYTDKMLSAKSSLTRHPGFNSEFAAHDQISILAVSPGKHFTGQSFPDVIGQALPEMKILIHRNPDGTVSLLWNADPTRSYSIWETDSLTMPLRQSASGLVFPGGQGNYQDLTQGGIQFRFYRLGSP